MELVSTCRVDSTFLYCPLSQRIVLYKFNSGSINVPISIRRYAKEDLRHLKKNFPRVVPSKPTGTKEPSYAFQNPHCRNNYITRREDEKTRWNTVDSLTPVHGNKILLIEEPFELLRVDFLDDRLGFLVATLAPWLFGFRPR